MTTRTTEPAYAGPYVVDPDDDPPRVGWTVTFGPEAHDAALSTLDGLPEYAVRVRLSDGSALLGTLLGVECGGVIVSPWLDEEGERRGPDLTLPLASADEPHVVAVHVW